MFENVLIERVVVIERGVNKVLKYTESCELFLNRKRSGIRSQRFRHSGDLPAGSTDFVSKFKRF